MRNHPVFSGFAGRLLVLLAVLLFAVILGAAVSSAQVRKGADYRQRQQELADLRSRIEASRKRAASLANDEKRQLSRLQALEQEAKDTRRLLKKLEDEERDLQARVDKLKWQLAASDSIMARRRARLSAQLRNMYKRSRRHEMAFINEGKDMNALARRIRAMTALARSERLFLDKVRNEHTVLINHQQELNSTLADVYRNHSQLAQQNASLAALQEERKKSLQAVHDERGRWEASVKELEHSAKALEKLLAQLERQRKKGEGSPSTGFASMKGKLPWPVSGKVFRRFGKSVHPRFKTVVMNKGLNISASAGAPIRVVARGTVDYVNWLPGYGKCIIVNHGDGWYTLYAHAREIFSSVGNTVETGEVIAEVGDTGSLDGSQLYFEVRHGKVPVDPSKWLARSRRSSR